MHLLKSLNRHPGARLVSVVTPQLNATPSQGPSSVTSSTECPLHLTTCTPSPQVTIEELPNKVLLNIFVYFLAASPRNWPTLMRICRQWRRVVFAYQRPLQLRLFCTHATPTLKMIDCWPTLPIVVQYGGSSALNPPAPGDEENIVAALKPSDRVTSIDLTVTSSLLERLSAIKQPFYELEDLVLLSQGRMRLTFPSSFQWGPRLRSLHLTRIIFPALHQLLYSSKNLVDLHLYDVLDPSRFPPQEFIDSLSEMGQLQSLSLRFPSTTTHIPRDSPAPSGKHFKHPVLTRLKFWGFIEYLDGLVFEIDAPRLGNIEVTFFDEIRVIDLSTLRRFIERIDIHRSHRRAHILSSERAISISLTWPGGPSCLKFHFFHEPLREQLFCLSQICIQFSALLFNVEDLSIKAQRPLGQEDIHCSEKWLDPIISCRSVKWLHVCENLSTLVVRSLQLQYMKTALPDLHKLFIKPWIREPGPRHSQMRESVVSLMVYRRLTSRPVEVEYEQISVNEPGGSGKGPLFQPATIERLSDDILLNVFRHYLADTPRIWPMLGWVCQQWRRIIFSSPLGLNLRLYCTHGTPVLRFLDCWPTLPIIVQYGGVPNLDPPALQDDDNIIAALKQSSRVSSISLTVTRPLLEKLSAISEPFLELEELSLLSLDNMESILPSTFRWGPPLRTLHSTKIAFPLFPQLLSTSHGLVDLQLHETPRSGYFSPEAFANALSGTIHLRTLSLHFLSLPPRRNFLRFPPQPGERIVLPALTCLKYRGTSKYLDSFVARIDAPHLEEIDITFFCQPTMDTSQLGRFIQRIEMQTTPSQALIETAAHAISISFTNSGASTPLRLQMSCKQLDWQLSCMAQVCDQIPPFLLNIGDLGINTAQLPDGQDGISGEQWLDLLRKFGGAKRIRVDGELTTDILCVLDTVSEGNTHILPSLRHIRVQKPMVMDGPSWTSIQSFITKRSIPGRLVEVNAPSYQCHICHNSFKEQQGLKRHLRDKHGYQILCSYCGEFECRPGRNDLFREHLESKHAEVARNDGLISKPSLTPSQLVGLFKRHSSLRAPDIVKPSPTAIAPPHSPDPDT